MRRRNDSIADGLHATGYQAACGGDGKDKGSHIAKLQRKKKEKIWLKAQRRQYDNKTP